MRTPAIFPTFLSLVLLVACTNLDLDRTSSRGGIGKADLVGSCVNSECDGPAPDGDCYCDDECESWGDCCADKQQVCGCEDGACGDRWIDVATGYRHSCGVRDDGTLACWGDNEFGQTTPPAGGGFVAVEAQDDNSCATRVDGSVACWGKWAPINATPPDAFTAVAVGGTHVCGLKSDATIACWGSNHNRQSEPPVGEFVALGLGWSDGCAVDADGILACWGWGYTTGPSEQVPWGTPFAALRDHCGLRTDGRVVCWGDSVRAPSQGKFTALAGNYYFGCGLRPDARVECWSHNSDTVAPPDGSFVSVSASNGSPWIASPGHACAIDADGAVVCWGSNEYGQATPPL